MQKNYEITLQNKIKSAKFLNLTRQYAVCLKGQNQHFWNVFEQNGSKGASRVMKIFPKTLPILSSRIQHISNFEKTSITGSSSITPINYYFFRPLALKMKRILSILGTWTCRLLHQVRFFNKIIVFYFIFHWKKYPSFNPK